MTTDKKHISDLHAEHASWLKEASFYADELKIFKERLTEVAGKNTQSAITKQIEHFQSQFMIQQEQMDILNHETKEHEAKLAEFAQEHPVAIDHRLFDNHQDFLDKVNSFKKIFGELKTEFKTFLSAAM